MEHQLDPTHAAERERVIEKIKRSIARAVFGAADKLDKPEEVESETNLYNIRA